MQRPLIVICTCLALSSVVHAKTFELHVAVRGLVTTPVQGEVSSSAPPAPASAKLAVTPGALTFGVVEVGKSREAAVTILNEGGSAATLGFSGLASPYQLTETCPDVLVPGASCQATVLFSPQQAGDVPAQSLLISGGEALASVALSGSGLVVEYGKVSTLATTGFTVGVRSLAYSPVTQRFYFTKGGSALGLFYLPASFSSSATQVASSNSYFTSNNPLAINPRSGLLYQGMSSYLRWFIPENLASLYGSYYQFVGASNVSWTGVSRSGNRVYAISQTKVASNPVDSQGVPLASSLVLADRAPVAGLGLTGGVDAQDRLWVARSNSSAPGLFSLEVRAGDTMALQQVYYPFQSVTPPANIQEVVVTDKGTVIIASTTALYTFDPATQATKVLAGVPGVTGSKNGVGQQAGFQNISAVVYRDNMLYVADSFRIALVENLD